MADPAPHRFDQQETTVSRPLEMQVLLPVHNEGESIEATLREIYNEYSPRIPMGFIICEDGSVDNTKSELRRLSAQIPMNLIMSDERKGYSKAVKDGMKALDAPYLLCIDSDGQCDPRDLWKIWDERDRWDLCLGWRTHRADNWVRRYLSRFFYIFYQAMFRVPVHDPSCPFVLAKKAVIARLVDELGEMKQGFWWEFVARVHRRGFSIKEFPIHHRLRSAGETQVYKFRKMPGIFLHHFIALFKIWSQTRHKS